MAALLNLSAAPKRSMKESLLAAAFFAGQLTLAATVLITLYRVIKIPGLSWALVTAVMVLYPGVAQSFSAALLRLLANFLGCGIGFTVGYLLGQETWHVVIAMIVVIFVGELLHMDMALRTACVASIIVMTGLGDSLEMTALERLFSAFIGGVAAILVQLAVLPLRKYMDFVPKAQASPQTARE